MNTKRILALSLLIFIFLFQTNTYCNSIGAEMYGSGISQEELRQRIESHIRDNKTLILKDRLLQISSGITVTAFTVLVASGLYMAIFGDSDIKAIGISMTSAALLVPLSAIPLVDAQNRILGSKERIEQLEKLKKQHCI